MKESLLFLDSIVSAIAGADKLHSRNVSRNIEILRDEYPKQFFELLSLIYQYFKKLGVQPARIATDYLRMISDMRKEGLYFYKTGEYRCKNQNDAYELVYSKPEVMSYYMHALLVSQVLWRHHFELFIFFEQFLKGIDGHGNDFRILDVGPGHGFFSYLVKMEFPHYRQIDVVDISNTSLEMTRNIIGEDNGRIKYFETDIFKFNDSQKYDLILLGEVIEHLDNPASILTKLASLLSANGLFWITTPTNSPALDHVYLFNSRSEVVSLILGSGLSIVSSCHYFAEDVNEENAIKNRVTDLIGLFCKKS